MDRKRNSKAADVRSELQDGDCRVGRVAGHSLHCELASLQGRGALTDRMTWMGTWPNERTSAASVSEPAGAPG